MFPTGFFYGICFTQTSLFNNFDHSPRVYSTPDITIRSFQQSIIISKLQQAILNPLNNYPILFTDIPDHTCESSHMYKQPRTAILKPFYIQKKGSHTFSDYPSLFCHADVLSSASVIHFK